jgi:hypothetical protein
MSHTLFYKLTKYFILLLKSPLTLFALFPALICTNSCCFRLLLVKKRLLLIIFLFLMLLTNLNNDYNEIKMIKLGSPLAAHTMIITFTLKPLKIS